MLQNEWNIIYFFKFTFILKIFEFEYKSNFLKSNKINKLCLNEIFHSVFNMCEIDSNLCIRIEHFCFK
jgi:hypothetical protein